MDKQLKIDGWNWQVKDEQKLRTILDCFKKQENCRLVKKNDLREVVHIATPETGSFYLKHDFPQKIRSKIKSLFYSKVKSEYDSASMLFSHGIAIADYLGWGQKGSEGMLISCELRNSVNAKNWWFSECLENQQKQEAFLKTLTDFLTAFFQKDESDGKSPFHPDFHLGNLLYTPEDNKLFIIDPYGVKLAKCTPKQHFAMYRIIGALRGELSNSTASKLIQNCGMSTSSNDAEKLWQRIITAENDKMKKIWPKRKKQILSGKSKYCKTVQQDGQTYVLRISQGDQFYVEENDLASLKNLKLVELSDDEAEAKWLESFFLDFQRQKHNMPVTWHKGKGLYFKS